VPDNSGLSAQNLVGVSPGEICADAPKIPSDQLCAILFTSGSTGTPAPNLKYWETLRTGSLGNAAMLLENRKGRLNLLATVPPQHMWGFETSILLPLFADATVSHLTPFYPQDIADALESLPKSRALISSPVHLAALLKSGVQLVKLDRIFSSTAPLPRQLAKDLESRFNTHVLEIFGCSETGVMATRNTVNETLWQLSDLFTLESIKDGVLIRGQHLPEEIVLPDSIELTSDHRFRWLGRHQDMINIAGKRGSLTDLNHRLLAIRGVVDGVIFLPDSSSERLAAMVVAPNLNPADILGALKSQIEPVFLPRPLYMISDLPRQETGKLAKNVVLELFEKTRKARMPDYEQPPGQASTSDRDKTN